MRQTFIWIELFFSAITSTLADGIIKNEFMYSVPTVRNPISSRILANDSPHHIALDTDHIEIDDIDDSDSCHEVGPCLFCTADDLSRVDMLDACEQTGRRSKFICNEDKKGESSEYIEYRSCIKASTEDEMDMIRLQVICAIMAIVSLFSVRRHKQMSASLFDQRIRKRRNTSEAQIRAVNAADEENSIALSILSSRSGDGGLILTESERLLSK